MIILLVLAVALVVGCQKEGEGKETAKPTATPSTTEGSTADAGTPTPAPTEEPTPAPTATPVPSPKGTNVALKKPYEVSSFTYHARGWNPACINDGITEPIDGVHYGWTSKIGQYVDVDPDGITEWVIIDLEKEYNIAQVWAWPRQDAGAYFPNDYIIEVSNDRENWTKVYEMQDDPLSEAFDLSPRVIELTDVKARYVRFTGTELRDDSTTYKDGYLMQLAELEIYSEDEE